MAASRTLVTVPFSLQRAEHGEQPVRAGLAPVALPFVPEGGTR